MPLTDPDPGRPDPTIQLVNTLRSVILELREVARQRPGDERIVAAIADIEAATAKLEPTTRESAAV
jgi:hypothetical protein